MPKLVDYSKIKLLSNYTIPYFDKDFLFNEGGKWVFVSHIDKLLQVIQRELTILYDEDLNRGNEIFELFDNASSNLDFQLTRIKTDFQEALVRIQTNQSENTPPEELLSRIDRIDVNYVDDNKTDISITMSMTNILNKPLVFTLKSTDFLLTA